MINIEATLRTMTTRIEQIQRDSGTITDDDLAARLTRLEREMEVALRTIGEIGLAVLQRSK